VLSPSIVKKRTKSNTEISNHKPHVSKHLRLTESKHQPTQGSSRRCAMCSTKKKPQRTKWICSTCKVPLCIKNEKTCFQDYHTKKFVLNSNFLLLVIYFKRVNIYFILSYLYCLNNFILCFYYYKMFCNCFSEISGVNIGIILFCFFFIIY